MAEPLDVPCEMLPRRERRRQRGGVSSADAPSAEPMSGETKQTRHDVEADSPSLSELRSGGNEASAEINGTEQGESEADSSSGFYPADSADQDPGDCTTTLDTQPTYRSSAVGKNKFEYLDHTADVQLHSWGSTLEEAFEQCALAMFNYMTPIEGIAVNSLLNRHVTASGHDMESLLYAFLDELLFIFSTELFVCRQVKIERLDRSNWSIVAVGMGEKFDRGRHASGTEIKAITYSAMQILEEDGDSEVFVIVDI